MSLSATHHPIRDNVIIFALHPLVDEAGHTETVTSGLRLGQEVIVQSQVSAVGGAVAVVQQGVVNRLLSV